MARIEFYIGHSERFVAVVDDAAVPRQGEMINISKVTYRIDRVTWAVDYADRPSSALRANVEMSIPNRENPETHHDR